MGIDLEKYGYASLATDREKKEMFCAGVEPATFCVLSRCDNRYTNRTVLY